MSEADTTDESSDEGTQSSITPAVAKLQAESTIETERVVIDSRDDKIQVHKRSLPASFQATDRLQVRKRVTVPASSLADRAHERSDAILPSRALIESRHSRAGKSTHTKQRLSSLPFPDGAIRHSQVLDRHSDMSISKEDLFLNDKLERALIICFLVDAVFLNSVLRPGANVELVTEGMDTTQVPPSWTVQAFVAKPFQCMHTKVFLLQSPHFMRLIVSTANLIPIDFDHLDNIFYVHDFPMTREPRPSVFAGQLLRMLNDHQVESTLLQLLGRYDMSSCQVDLVVSIPGTYYGELEQHRFGQLALARIVAARIESEAQSSTTTTTVVTENCSSSIGNLNVAWIQSFRNSLSGDPATTACRVSPENTRLIYPSFRDIQSSTRHGPEGKPLAHNIVCNGQWSNPLFPRHLFHGYESQRRGTLFHAKSNLVHDGGVTPHFLVFGSHNYSQAAWGNVVIQGPRARYAGLKTVIANYEVSVFISGALLTDRALLPPGMDWRQSVTYRQESLTRYGETDTPWTVRIMR